MTPYSFLLVFALVILAFAGSHATLTKEELYWKSVFPNTPMPKDLQDALPRPGQSTTFTSKVDPESKGVNDPPDGNYAYDGDYRYNWDYGYEIWDVNYDDNYAAAPPNNEFGGHDHAAPNNKGINNPESGSKHSLARQSNYWNVSAIKENIYFFQETLLPGNKLYLPRLTLPSDKTLFLSQQIAESIPMSSDKLSEILETLSLKAESSYADNVRIAVRSCERGGMRGEEKYCATSLESLIDLSVSMLGKNIILLSHQLEERPKDPLFTIGKGTRDMGDNNIVCHKMRYPYAVYLCHSIRNTTVYEVPVLSMDGTKANGVAVCHKETTGWDPNHVSFQYLKVKPGTVPICHFVSRNTVVWVPN